MSCPGELLSGWLDGELDAEEAERVAAHVAGCAACAAEVRGLEALGEVLGAAAPAPTPLEWARFQKGLQDDLRAVRPVPSLGRWLLAAAALLLAGAPALLVLRGRELPVHAAPARLPTLQLEAPAPTWRSRETPWPAPAPEALEPDRLRAAGLGPEAAAVLERAGMVQLPTRATRLGELIPGPQGPLPPLATADASLLVGGAVLARAGLTVEYELLRPGLVRLLTLLAHEAQAAQAQAADPGVRDALLRLRERAVVGLLLEGSSGPAFAALGPETRARLEEEAALVRGGAGVRESRIEPGRRVDDRAFVPRGGWSEEGLADHARAAAWVSAWSPRLDAAHPQELRQACLAALLLARGRFADGRSGLHQQAELEAALELLSGPPDGLGPLDVAAALAEVLGGMTPAPDALAAPGVLERLGEVLRGRARARGLPGVRALDQGEAAPRFQLLGGTRTLEAWALDRLGGLPGRERVSALDLPALLGSRRARAALAAAGLDAPGLDAALAELRPASQAFLRPGSLIPARTCLEQARDWSAAALLGRLEPASPAPAQAGPAWPDRALLAGMAGLVAPRPAPDVAPGAALRGAPLVEPLPVLHARVAFAARRLGVALRELLPESPRRARALAQLERLVLVEEALRDASLDLLEGRSPRPECLRGLRLWAATVHELGPPDARVADPLYELGLPGGGLRVVHRAVVRLDRLVEAVFDPRSGRVVLAEGPAALACELVSDGERLERPEAIAAHPAARTPAWATHVVPR